MEQRRRSIPYLLDSVSNCHRYSSSRNILMYTPRLAFGRVGNIGQRLPDPYRSFGREQIHFRRGATSMIAGVPGAFKSVVALNMVKRWADQNITTMYFSADGDEFTVIRRLAGIITGDSADI